MEIIKAKQSKIKNVDFDNLGFGEVFSDHMVSADYADGQWKAPRIAPYGPIEIYPSNTSIHYGQVVFEGLKAFYTNKGINMFRPEQHHERMNRSSRRLCIPETEYGFFIEALKGLIALDKDWVPGKKGTALYIRPFVFATDNYLGVRVSKTYRFMIITSPVGAYFKEGFNPVSLITSDKYVRAVKGGLGEAKTPANYAASLLPAEEAKKAGFSQVLWLDGVEGKYIDEVGTMNVFFLIGDELITPVLEGNILKGITRDSVITLARKWGVTVVERRISMEEVINAADNGTLKEVFGTGTAAVISPVGKIQHNDTSITVNNGQAGELSLKLFNEITGIQYGEKEDEYGWCVTIK
jgi:branched-chain amino acid aminotransferase